MHSTCLFKRIEHITKIYLFITNYSSSSPTFVHHTHTHTHHHSNQLAPQHWEGQNPLQCLRARRTRTPHGESSSFSSPHYYCHGEPITSRDGLLLLRRSWTREFLSMLLKMSSTWYVASSCMLTASISLLHVQSSGADCARARWRSRSSRRLLFSNDDDLRLAAIRSSALEEHVGLVLVAAALSAVPTPWTARSSSLSSSDTKLVSLSHDRDRTTSIMRAFLELDGASCACEIILNCAGSAGDACVVFGVFPVFVEHSR